MAKIYLTNLPSDVSGYKLALVDTRNPNPSLATAVTNTVASGTSIQMTATAGGTALKWITKPIAAAVTIPAVSALISGWALESNAAANASIGFGVYKYDVSASSPLAASPFISYANATELTTSIASRRAGASAGTSTDFDAGDRIVIQANVVNVGTMGGSRTVTMDFDGPTDAADGDTWVDVPATFRVSERQLMTGSVPTQPGWTKGSFQEVIDRINGLVASKQFSADSTVQKFLDDMAAERDNN